MAAKKQGEGKEPMEAVDMDRLLKLFQMLGQYGPMVYAGILQLLTLLANKPQQFAAAPVRCGPGGDKDHAKCCDAALEHALQTTAILMHLKCCCEQDDRPQPQLD